ncbi:MAG: ABC transporter permease [Chloroflexi bacterium]|nr:ABC transporter permease [Chloroflexota bacterium]MBV9896767.1 ABC transporter permease [Chloroflexota bacterium]
MATAAPSLATPTVVRRAPRVSSARSPLLQALSRTLQNPMGLIGATIVAVLVVAALVAPLITPYNPVEQHPGLELQPPSGQFWLGTDHLGRDLLSRILFGSRSSMLIGVLAVGLGAAFGIGSGLAAGYLGGWVDTLLMRLFDALLSFPAILLGIGVVSVLGSGPLSVAYALAVATVPTFARLMRARVLSEREREYVVAARCIGARAGRIMWLHVLPNAIAPLLIQISLSMGFAVLAESALTFLGLGTQPPTPSWGGMLNESRAYLRTAPWFGIFPGLALALLLLGLNLLTDALRDALDPRRTNA